MTNPTGGLDEIVAEMAKKQCAAIDKAIEQQFKDDVAKAALGTFRQTPYGIENATNDSVAKECYDIADALWRERQRRIGEKDGE